MGPSGPHEVRAFSATRLLLQKGFTTYITTQALPGCQLSQLTNVKHDLKGYYTIKREGGWFSITEISTSFCCTDCISQSPILLNNLLLSLISVLWTLNWKDHSYFICIRKFDIFRSNGNDKFGMCVYVLCLEDCSYKRSAFVYLCVSYREVAEVNGSFLQMHLSL